MKIELHDTTSVTARYDRPRMLTVHTDDRAEAEELVQITGPGGRVHGFVWVRHPDLVAFARQIIADDDRRRGLTAQARMHEHDGYAPHSHEVRPDHLGVAQYLKEFGDLPARERPEPHIVTDGEAEDGGVAHRGNLTGHLHTHPDHAGRYPAGHDFVLVPTVAIRQEHERQHRENELQHSEQEVTGYAECPDCKGSIRETGHTGHYDDEGRKHYSPEDLESDSFGK